MVKLAKVSSIFHHFIIPHAIRVTAVLYFMMLLSVISIFYIFMYKLARPL